MWISVLRRGPLSTSQLENARICEEHFMSGNSPVFDRMLSLPMKETLTGIVEIEDLKSEVFEEMLRFIYTNEFDAEGDYHLKEMMVAADKYEIDDLKSKCEDILAERLSVSFTSGITQSNSRRSKLVNLALLEEDPPSE
ncbi:TD and POZ domain-containing protein 4-like [Belonocnema kinseyi]|uniref:TD and POZ domain-containing protein 4-like n=1 Tax=Belonocnema kinseyi TaxID=2817044 RepID=UPI00143CDBD7|nr:TD and POZ domain-containing protein 4-like [Belonocnema kinseyi]